MQPRLKFLDRYLTLWIFLAMAVGIAIGVLYSGVGQFIDGLSVGTTNIPLSVGLILMMYPPLAKVDYKLMPKALSDGKVLSFSLLLNWVVGPLFMFALATLFFAHQPDYMVGLILIGSARCIAMVLVWNDLASGNREYGAILVALNSIFQVLTYSVYVYLFSSVLPAKMGLTAQSIEVPFTEVLISVLIYLGIPFALGYLSRVFLIKLKGQTWFTTKYLPAVSPITLYALLFTIVLMFSLKGDKIFELPWQVLSVAVPLALYFGIMFFVSFFVGRWLKIPYDKNTAVAFTATGNNFELAIAVSIAVFGLNSSQAFVGVIGPLVEVPALILLVKAALWFKLRYPSLTFKNNLNS